jgi:hypothetical protein
MKYNQRQNIPKIKEALLIALEMSLGIVTPACKEVGISRSTFYVYYNSDPIFKLAVDDINEITLDFVENALLKKITDGDMSGIQFHLKYRGRGRGYGIDRSDINNNLSGDTTIKIIRDNEPPDKA